MTSCAPGLGHRARVQGGGIAGRKTLMGHRFSLKRLRVTAREVEASSSTRNVYGLPLFYSYGVGSADFGAFREVAGHEMANR
jgi:hypothetical protein